MTDIRSTFDQYDEDGNGEIDLLEFRAIVEKLGLPLDPAAAEQLFDSIDEDETGLIDFEEFAAWWASRSA